jgi:hypothetical protein
MNPARIPANHGPKVIWPEGYGVNKAVDRLLSAMCEKQPLMVIARFKRAIQ